MSLNLLVERLPIFRRPYRPLKIGIHRDIMALELMDERSLEAGLRAFTASLQYQYALRAGGARCDLNGEPCGELTTKQQQGAQEQLKVIHRSRWCARRSGSPNRPGRSILPS
jgi:ProP effector